MSKNNTNKNNNKDKVKKFNIVPIIKSLGNFIKYNRQYISFVLLTLLSCMFLRYNTIGNFFNIKGTFFDLSVIILLGSLAYFFKPKKQFTYFFTVMMVITIINIINAVYYSFFSSFVSVSLLATLGQATEQGGAVLEKLKLANFIYLISPIIFVIINRVLKSKDYFTVVEKVENSKKLLVGTAILGGICLFINISTLTGSDLSRITKQWNREYIVERYGIIIYQANDTIQSIYSQLNSMFGYEDAEKEFVEYFNSVDLSASKNKYTGMFEGYNVIAIHLESMMSFLINLKINGVEVTPTLNQMAKDSMYFDNFYSQVSVGTSSDAEFTFSSSLMPVQSGTVAVSYYNRSYVTLQSLLKDKNYYTFSMHGNKASMWNRSKLHKSLGYMDFYSQEMYEMDEIIGLGLSDRSFFNQSEQFIKEIDEMVDESDEFNNYMGTLIMLSNHTPFADPYYTEGENSLDVRYHTGEYDEFGEEIIYDYLEGTTLGNYLKSVHYADQCLGELIEYMKTHDEFKNTLVVMYGDHAAQLSKNQFDYFINYDFTTGEVKTEEDPTYIDYDYYSNELFKNVPLFIWSTDTNKNNKIKRKVSYPMGMIDIQPTLNNMLGLYNKYALGNDIFEVKDDNMVVFANGNFLTNKVYYYNSKNEFKILGTDVTIDETYIDERKQKAEKILDLSNDIIVYDLIKRAGDKIGGETNG